MNIAVVGSVDAGKTSCIGVLTKGIYDDGNGKARSMVSTHAHEVQSGRTSDIGFQRLFADPSDPQKDKNTSEYVHLIDLAGHEAYLRTTLRGLTNYYPSYAIVVINLNKGLTRITAEHISVCRGLHIPFIIVFSKSDLAPSDVAEDTVKRAKEVCRAQGIKFFYETSEKEPEKLREILEVYDMNSSVVCPYIIISNKTGSGIGLLRSMLLRLPFRSPKQDPRLSLLTQFAQEQQLTSVFLIYKPFWNRGIGWILHGLNVVGTLRKNDRLWLGPLGSSFHEMRVRSIHNEKREEITELEPGVSGCIAFRLSDPNIEINRRQLCKGKVCLNQPFKVTKIRADILVGNSEVTITKGYRPYLHFSNASIGGVFIESEKFPLRARDRASVVIQFDTPQFAYTGCRFLFREGKIRGIGLIREVIV